MGDAWRGAPSSPLFGHSLPGSGVRRLFPSLFFSFFFFLFLVPPDCSHSLNRYTGPPPLAGKCERGLSPFFLQICAVPFCPRTRSGLLQSLGSFFSFLFLVHLLTAFSLSFTPLLPAPSPRADPSPRIALRSALPLLHRAFVTRRRCCLVPLPRVAPSPPVALRLASPFASSRPSSHVALAALSRRVMLALSPCRVASRSPCRVASRSPCHPVVSRHARPVALSRRVTLALSPCRPVALSHCARPVALSSRARRVAPSPRAPLVTRRDARFELEVEEGIVRASELVGRECE
jgi:hypothetical protein